MTATVTKAPKAAQNVQAKFVAARQELASALIERDGEIDLVLTALIAGEHPLLVGPPGTGKSLLLDSLMTWLSGAKRFTILFTKFSTPEEVFGPISVQGLKADQYRRVTTGRLPEADLAFTDEIFKASSAILNTMLRILNERTYENGDGTMRKCPLQICVAASNEWPGDQDGGKELGALFDRFLLRKKVKPIVSKAGRKRLLWAKNLTPSFSSQVTPAEIAQARQEAQGMGWSEEAEEGLEKIIDAINAEGIYPGDRRLRKSVQACQAYAYLCGASEVETEHLEILAHTLWEDPTEQPEKVAKVVAKIANPVGMMVNEKLMIAEDVVAKCTPTDAVPKLQELQKELKKLSQDARVTRAIGIIGEHIKSCYKQVIGVEN
jgi:MoxR-like ATPase